MGHLKSIMMQNIVKILCEHVLLYIGIHIEHHVAYVHMQKWA